MENTRVLLSMGSGGRLSQELTQDVFLSAYGNEVLNGLEDSAELNIGFKRVAFTTDSFTIKPVFFPGGDIGKISICGTVNDLAAKGARPLAISAGFILEEGFSIEELKRISRSMQQTASQAGISIVTADTKVVGKGEADGIFINTSGVGLILPGMEISSRNAKSGDDIIISGTIADHGMAVLNARQNLGFSPPIVSDVTAVNAIVEKISLFGKNIHAMRDPTRGGLGTVLNEIAKASRVNMEIFEENIPVLPQVEACCEILGLDPLYVANEGKLVIFTSPHVTNDVLRLIRSLVVGRDAVVIGKVREDFYSDEIPAVCMQTRIGTKRFVPMLEGEQLPRIC